MGREELTAFEAEVREYRAVARWPYCTARAISDDVTYVRCPDAYDVEYERQYLDMEHTWLDQINRLIGRKFEVDNKVTFMLYRDSDGDVLYVTLSDWSVYYGHKVRIGL